MPEISVGKLKAYEELLKAAQHCMIPQQTDVHYRLKAAVDDVKNADCDMLDELCEVIAKFERGLGCEVMTNNKAYRRSIVRVVAIKVLETYADAGDTLPTSGPIFAEICRYKNLKP